MKKVQYEQNTTWKKNCSEKKAYYEEIANCKNCRCDKAHDENIKIIQHGKNRNCSKCGREIDHHQS